MNNQIQPMLCEELSVDERLLKGLTGEKATKLYRDLIAKQLSGLMARGFVAERKGRWKRDGILPWTVSTEYPFSLGPFVP